jgi:hypothetical protein
MQLGSSWTAKISLIESEIHRYEYNISSDRVCFKLILSDQKTWRRCGTYSSLQYRRTGQSH